MKSQKGDEISKMEDRLESREPKRVFQKCDFVTLKGIGQVGEQAPPFSEGGL